MGVVRRTHACAHCGCTLSLADQGGAYSYFDTLAAGNCDSEWTFLGLTEEQWMYVGIAAVAFLFVLMIASRVHSHKLHKRRTYSVQAQKHKPPPRHIRAGHGYAAGPLQNKGGRGGAPLHGGGGGNRGVQYPQCHLPSGHKQQQRRPPQYRTTAAGSR